MLFNIEHKILCSLEAKIFDMSVYRWKSFYRLSATNKTFFSINFVSTWNDIFINKLFSFVWSEPLIREKLISGKLLIVWRHDLCAEITKKRYINDQEVMRLAHAEIVNLFFPQETSDESDEINSETSDKSSKFTWHELVYDICQVVATFQHSKLSESFLVTISSVNKRRNFKRRWFKCAGMNRIQNSFSLQAPQFSLMLSTLSVHSNNGTAFSIIDSFCFICFCESFRLCCAQKYTKTLFLIFVRRGEKVILPAQWVEIFLCYDNVREFSFSSKTLQLNLLSYFE